MKTKLVLLLSVCLGLSLSGWSQERTDSIAAPPADTTAVDSLGGPVQNIESFAKRYDPRKAILYAAVFPGAGQVYNKKYWKLPLVYGGFALLINAIGYYQSQYKFAKNELFYTINENTTTSPAGYTQDQLRTIVDQTRRQRDFMVVITGLVYILQMVDAHVDSHLKEFDLNPKLQVRVEPRFIQNSLMGRTSGVALVFRF